MGTVLFEVRRVASGGDHLIAAGIERGSRARHMVDNMGAAMGALPDEAMRKRMIVHIEQLG